jgi:hypothetical protein
MTAPITDWPFSYSKTNRAALTTLLNGLDRSIPFTESRTWMPVGQRALIVAKKRAQREILITALAELDGSATDGLR